ncbi:Metallo-dependent phosphatase-like protein [Apiosordaria backusii]|uniref:Metallo-dependent phosphatase-like protein n=1 Tax=Apiosordaria backusii TaxID=314023 RepID=A0AA40BL91_9PEZI|nr:Metallo-dependent phosphatase-like protein [Apiosordaria backusii]
MGAAHTPTAEPTMTFASGRDVVNDPPEVRILHFNDVYHLDSSSAEPAGGASRFMTVVKEYHSPSSGQPLPDLVPLFSGDVFNPSLESSITKGSHMVPILNSIGTLASCVGNHDLDFGVRQFRHLSSKCNFPWLLANVLDPALGEGVPLGNAKKTHMITTSNGIKIGLIGLGEREWLDTINSLPPGIIYRSVSEVAKELVPELKEQGADVIIALTHQREPNDNKLAKNLGGGMIDIILGGHDHFYAHSYINGTHVLRSGADFKQLSYIELRRSQDLEGVKKWDVDIIRRDIVRAIKKDPETEHLVEGLTSKLKKSLEKPIGWTAEPLDARFTTVRTRESNIGNWVCDIMRGHYGTDCALMAAGTIRGDQIYAPGPIRVKDVTDCFPFEDPVVVIKAAGKNIWEALENGVSSYPALEGRFPQVSNIKFTFDPSLPAGSRVLSVEIGGQPLEKEKIYVMATRGYMARGKDGYNSLLIQSEGGDCEEVVSEENGILISAMLRQYFMALTVMHKWARWGPSLARHWDKVVQEIASSCPILPASPTDTYHPGDRRKQSDTSMQGWDSFTPAKLRERRSSVSPLVGHAEDDSSDESSDEDALRTDARNCDKELRVMRKFFRKWCRLVGVDDGKDCVEGLKDGEVEVSWTRPIRPKLEGRIVMVSSHA